MKTLRQLIYEWLAAVVGAAEDGSQLAGAQVCGTAWDPVESEKVLMVGPIKSKSLAPDAGAEEMLDCDAEVVVILLKRVGEALAPADYAEAYDAAELMGKALAGAVIEDMTLGDRVGDCLPDELARTVDKVQEVPHGIGNLKLKVNQTEQLLGE